MKLPTVTGREVIKLLLKMGFIVVRQKGSHVSLYKKDTEGKGLHVTVPDHGSKEIPTGTLLSIIRQSGMTRDEFVKNL